MFVMIYSLFSQYHLKAYVSKNNQRLHCKSLPEYWREEMWAADDKVQEAVAAEVLMKRNANCSAGLADTTLLLDNDVGSAAKFAPVDWSKEPLHLLM